MNAFGKKILSAFIDMPNDGQDKTPLLRRIQNSETIPLVQQPETEPDGRFAAHFDKLFADAHIPGPGYYEFSKMIAAMQSIPHEQSRYSAAFAGLQVQGLSKEKLLASVQQHMQLLEDDTTTFQQTVSAAFEEKVGSKREAVTKAKDEIQALSQRILQLQEQVTVLTAEIAENEAKIQNSNSGYTSAMEACKKDLLNHIEKINQYLS